MPDATVSLLGQRIHAALDEKAGTFEPAFAEMRLDLDRLAPNKDAATERQGEVKAVPSTQYPAMPGGEHNGDNRHASKTRGIDDTDAGLHRRAARPVRRDADAIAGS